MTDAVETMAYAGEVPWHGLGVPVSENMTPIQMLKAAGLNWTVSKRPLYREVKGKYVALPGVTELVRDSDDAHFDIVSEALWKPVQNADSIGFFAKFVKEAKMSLETAGALWDGKYVWVLARVKHDFVLGKGKGKDEVQSYLLLASPHVNGKALIAMHTMIRVVCWNTLTAALGGSWNATRGKANVFRMPHSQNFDAVTKQKAEEALGLSVKQSEEFEAIATKLSKTKAKPEHVETYFADVLQFDPKDAVKKKDGEIKLPRMLSQFNDALLRAPGQDLPSAEGTWWGALNAVTYVVDHEIGHARETALRSAWFGDKAILKRRALDLAVEAAK